MQSDSDSAIFEGLKCKVTATDVRPTSRIAILLVEMYRID
jgi:hypothetical protein